MSSCYRSKKKLKSENEIRTKIQKMKNSFCDSLNNKNKMPNDFQLGILAEISALRWVLEDINISLASDLIDSFNEVNKNE
jgi:hypothetical protein